MTDQPTPAAPEADVQTPVEPTPDELAKVPNLDKASTDKATLDAPAGSRVGHGVNTPTVMGKMDNMSVRSAADALEGHFVEIDRTFKGVKQAYVDAGISRDDSHDKGAYEHTGSYGVYLEPLDIDTSTGIPESALVRLRDDTNGLVRVPYAALSRSVAGGR